MKRFSMTVVAASVVSALVACESATVSSPTPRSPSAVASAAGVPSCSITLPPPAHRPLFAVREITNELNHAFANSGTSCGIVQGVGARMNRLVSVLDQVSGQQNLDAACGIATGLLNELQGLVSSNQLNPIIVPGDPDASPNVIDNLTFVRGEFCENAGHTVGQ